MKRQTLKFTYINYRNEKSVRTVIPECVHFGSTDWHKEEQWFLKAWDTEKQQHRDFALKDIITFDHDHKEEVNCSPDFHRPMPKAKIVLPVMENVMEDLRKNGVKFQMGMSHENNIGTISLENGEYIRFNEG